MDVLQKRALLIKPSYNEANRLNGTENDVQNVKKVLTGKFDFKETAIKVLKDDQATKKNILKELSELTESCESHSVVLVYYTGHGTYLEDSQDEGLCPTVSQCQTEPEEPKEERCITGQDLSPFFEALSKKSVYCTVIFDCCYSGHLYRDKEEEGVKIKQLRTKPSATASKHKKYTKADRGGWIPGDKDNFFYFAACTSDELAKEKKEGGYLTLAIADTLDKLQYLDQVTYEAFYRLLRKEFREKNWHNVQTPQFEAGNFKTVLFGTSQVEQAEGGVEISEVISTEEFVLSSGSVQGLRSGCYLVYKATASEQSIKKGSSSPDYLGTIAVKESQIQSTHAIGSSDRPQPKITCGCLAYLQAAARVKRSAYFSPAPLDMTIKEPLILELNKSDMFTVVAYPPTVTVNDPDPIGITCETIKSKSCWVARRSNRILVPPISVDRESIMAKNLCRYIRYETIFDKAQPPKDDASLLKNVNLKVFKVENVKYNNKTRSSVIAKELQNRNNVEITTVKDREVIFKAHEPDGKGIKPGSGDSFLYQVINKNDTEIHICVILYQCDGEIKAIYPRKKGGTTLLRRNDTAEDIAPLFIPDGCARAMAEPDPAKEEPQTISDTLVLYASTKPVSYGAILQSAIQTDPDLSRGAAPNSGPLSELEDFLNIRMRPIPNFADEEGMKYTIKKVQIFTRKHNSP